MTSLEQRRSRPLPSGVGERFEDPDAPLVPSDEVPWLVPVPVDPSTAAVERGRLRLALVAALQLLPSRQRAALLLREVLEVPAAEVADLLGMTTAAVNSALQRARARLAQARVDVNAGPPPPAAQRAVVERYAAAFERADVAAITALLARDVILEMPPMWNWYVGVDAYAGFMNRVYRTRGTGWRAAPVWANGEAGFLAYVDDVPHSVQLFTLAEGRIVRASVFADPAVIELFRVADPVR